MKNLKNMLFAAAIGTFAFVLPAVANAEVKTTTTDGKVTITDATSDNDVITSGTYESITVTTGKLTINGDVTINGAVTGGTKIVLGNNASITTPTTNGAINSIATLTTTDANMALYNTSKGVERINTVFKVAKKVTPADVKASYLMQSDKTQTVSVPSALLYGYVAPVDGEHDINNSDNIKSIKDNVVTLNANAKTATTITYLTGLAADATDSAELVINIVEDKVASSDVNDKAVDAIIKDFVDTKNAGSTEFKTEYAHGTNLANLTFANNTLELDVDGITVGEVANADLKDKLNGYEKLVQFDATATVGGKQIIKLPGDAKFVLTVENAALKEPTKVAGKKVAYAVYNLHTDKNGKQTVNEVANADVKFDDNKLTLASNELSTFAIGYKYVDENATETETKTDTKEATTGDATKEANPKTSDNVMTSVVSLLVSAFGLTAAGLKLKNN